MLLKDASAIPFASHSRRKYLLIDPRGALETSRRRARYWKLLTDCPFGNTLIKDLDRTKAGVIASCCETHTHVHAHTQSHAQTHRHTHVHTPRAQQTHRRSAVGRSLSSCDVAGQHLLSRLSEHVGLFPIPLRRCSLQHPRDLSILQVRLGVVVVFRLSPHVRLRLHFRWQKRLNKTRANCISSAT